MPEAGLNVQVRVAGDRARRADCAVQSARVRLVRKKMTVQIIPRFAPFLHELQPRHGLLGFGACACCSR